MLSKLCLTGFCNFARVTEVVLGSDIPGQITFLASEGKVGGRARRTLREYLLAATAFRASIRRSMVFWTSSMLFDRLLFLASFSCSTRRASIVAKRTLVSTPKLVFHDLYRAWSISSRLHDRSVFDIQGSSIVRSHDSSSSDRPVDVDCNGNEACDDQHVEACRTYRAAVGPTVRQPRQESLVLERRQSLIYLYQKPCDV